MHEIRLYDEIGGWGITAEEFAAGIPADATEITVRINTPGGAVSDGLAMYHYLKDHAAHVTTIVDGYAASMGSVVALAGDVRKVHKASMVMIHQPWGGAVGNADEMRETAAVLDVHAEALLSIYEDATGMAHDELKAMLDGETWMRGQAALDYGFATELIETTSENTEQAAAHGAFASLVSALTEGRELMSKQKTRKDIETELEEASASIVTITAEAETAKVDAVAKLDAAQVATVTAEKDRDEITARLDIAEASIVSMKEAHAAVEIERDEAKADAASKAEEVEKAQKALSNPAVADAILADAKAKVQADLDAEADAAEAKAKADAEEARRSGSIAPHYDKYRELMEAGEARQARSYWKLNEADIAKEQKALIAVDKEQG